MQTPGANLPQEGPKAAKRDGRQEAQNAQREKGRNLSLSLPLGRLRRVAADFLLRVLPVFVVDVRADRVRGEVHHEVTKAAKRDGRQEAQNAQREREMPGQAALGADLCLDCQLSRGETVVSSPIGSGAAPLLQRGRFAVP